MTATQVLAHGYHTMNAVVCTRYGPPEVLQLSQVAKPAPRANEVLIRVRAGVVGPSDCAFRKGDPFVIKLMYGLARPRLAVQGVEFAGDIEAVGPEVKRFKPGERVWGISPDRFGAHAEYLCLPEDKPIAHLPAGMTYPEAAGICDGGLTALTFLRDKAHLRAGQELLINGASGAVGAYAVQLAKVYGANVTGVCGTANVALVKSLGADQVIDYRREDPLARRQAYDVIFDAVGKSTFGRCRPALKPNGLYLTTVPSAAILLQMLRTSADRGQKAIFIAAGLQQRQENLHTLGELFAAGKLRAVIDHSYPLARVSEAHRYVETGHKKGNVVILV